MVANTGKTQVANNSIGIYGNMNKYTGKNPLVYIFSMPYNFYFCPRQLLAILRSGSTIIFQS